MPGSPARCRGGPGRGAGRPGWRGVPRTAPAGRRHSSSARARRRSRPGQPLDGHRDVRGGDRGAPGVDGHEVRAHGPIGRLQPGHGTTAPSRCVGAPLNIAVTACVPASGDAPGGSRPASRPCSATRSTVCVHVVQARAQSLASRIPGAHAVPQQVRRRVLPVPDPVRDVLGEAEVRLRGLAGERPPRHRRTRPAANRSPARTGWVAAGTLLVPAPRTANRTQSVQNGHTRRGHEVPPSPSMKLTILAPAPGGPPSDVGHQEKAHGRRRSRRPRWGP